MIIKWRDDGTPLNVDLSPIVLHKILISFVSQLPGWMPTLVGSGSFCWFWILLSILGVKVTGVIVKSKTNLYPVQSHFLG